MKRQVDSVIENYVSEKLFGKVLSLGEIKSKLHGQNPAIVAQRVALALEGIHEEGGENNGTLVRSIQETVGTAEREAWCMSTQQTIEGIVEKWCEVESSFPVSEHCVTVFQEAKKKGQVVSNPQVNDVIIWQKYSAGVPTSQGHTGRVVVDGDSQVQTIEGNTSASTTQGVTREGDCVAKKMRDIKGYGNMHVLGFVRIAYKEAAKNA